MRLSTQAKIVTRQRNVVGLYQVIAHGERDIDRSNRDTRPLDILQQR